MVITRKENRNKELLGLMRLGAMGNPIKVVVLATVPHLGFGPRFLFENYRLGDFKKLPETQAV